MIVLDTLRRIGDLLIVPNGHDGSHFDPEGVLRLDPEIFTGDDARFDAEGTLHYHAHNEQGEIAPMSLPARDSYDVSYTDVQGILHYPVAFQGQIVPKSMPLFDTETLIECALMGMAAFAGVTTPAHRGAFLAFFAVLNSTLRGQTVR